MAQRQGEQRRPRWCLCYHPSSLPPTSGDHPPLEVPLLYAGCHFPVPHTDCRAYPDQLHRTDRVYQPAPGTLALRLGWMLSSWWLPLLASAPLPSCLATFSRSIRLARFSSSFLFLSLIFC